MCVCVNQIYGNIIAVCRNNVCGRRKKISLIDAKKRKIFTILEKKCITKKEMLSLKNGFYTSV